MSGTQTATRTDSYTEARLRAVMPEVGADFMGPAAANLITFERANKWTEELIFILQNRAAHSFQIQLRCTGCATIALDYRVSSDGSVRESATAGGINYCALPPGTTASLFVDLDFAARNIAIVQEYLRQRSWGVDGQPVLGTPVRDRVYSKDGYGFVRGKVGDWP